MQNVQREFKKISMAAKALVVDEGKVLILRGKQSPDIGSGEFDLPGGRLKPCEDFVQALKREVKEECGLNVKVIAPLKVFFFKAKDKSIRAGVNFLCEVEEKGEVKLSGEHASYEWANVNEILTNANYPDWLRDLIRRYLKIEELRKEGRSVVRAAKAFIVKNNRAFLLCGKKEPEFEEADFDLPGRQLKEDEDFIAGLRRETREECNLDVKVIAPLNTFLLVARDNTIRAGINFLCEMIGEEENIKLSEHASYAWAEINRVVSEGLFPTWLREIARKYFELMEMLHEKRD